MPCVYYLYSDSKKQFYTGSSRDENPSTRLKSHNAGKVRSTKSGKPWRLVNFELFTDYTLARKRELFLKTGRGRDWIKINFPQNKG